MRTFARISALLLCSTPAFAQLHVQVHAPAPPRLVVHAPRPPRVVVHAPRPPRVVVHAPAVHVPPPPRIQVVASPPLVVVRPGIRVVADSDQEVFYTHGWYWHCSPDGHWWRARHPRARWVVASPRVVPTGIVHMRGHYRHYHPHGRAEVRIEKRHHHKHWRAHGGRGRGRRG